MSSELCRRFPKAAEVVLSSRLHALASGETCARIAQALDLNAHVRFGAQAIGDGGRHSDNIAADVVEALIGALWLAQGEEAARAFIARNSGDMKIGRASGRERVCQYV